MKAYINFADQFVVWVGRAFAWGLGDPDPEAQFHLVLCVAGAAGWAVSRCFPKGQGHGLGQFSEGLRRNTFVDRC